MLDTKGPEIRVKKLSAPIEVTVGEIYRFTGKSENEGCEGCIPITYDHMAEDVAVGSRVLVDDGNISFMVVSMEGEEVLCRAETSGVIQSRKGVNLPEREVGLPAMTEQDREDLLFGIAQKVDFIAHLLCATGSMYGKLKVF